jgi:hypothetical protein
MLLRAGQEALGAGGRDVAGLGGGHVRGCSPSARDGDISSGRPKPSGGFTPAMPMVKVTNAAVWAVRRLRRSTPAPPRVHVRGGRDPAGCPPAPATGGAQTRAEGRRRWVAVEWTRTTTLFSSGGSLETRRSSWPARGSARRWAWTGRARSIRARTRSRARAPQPPICNAGCWRALSRSHLVGSVPARTGWKYWISRCRSDRAGFLPVRGQLRPVTARSHLVHVAPRSVNLGGVDHQYSPTGAVPLGFEGGGQLLLDLMDSGSSACPVVLNPVG